jgi:hypothetical protein
MSHASLPPCSGREILHPRLPHPANGVGPAQHPKTDITDEVFRRVMRLVLMERLWETRRTKSLCLGPNQAPLYKLEYLPGKA